MGWPKLQSSLKKTLAPELTPIKMNIIAPGVIKTKMGERPVQIFQKTKRNLKKRKHFSTGLFSPSKLLN